MDSNQFNNYYKASHSLIINIHHNNLIISILKIRHTPIYAVAEWKGFESYYKCSIVAKPRILYNFIFSAFFI